MLLSLKVPELVEKPLLIAETRPNKISDFLVKLSTTNLLGSATSLFEELEILNRQKVSPEERIRALETYRPVILSLCRQLAEHYWMAPLPLPELSKSHASLAESLWMELSYGYKLALLDKQKKRFFNIKGEKHTAFIVERAMEAMRELAMVYHQTYFSLPPALWSDFNQLYLYAAQQSLHDMNVAERGEPLASISLSYKKVLLMVLADPQRLSSSDIKRVADYVARHASHAYFKGWGLVDNPAGVFFVSLNSDIPPVAYSKNKREVNPKYDIFLITVDLARLVHKHIQQLKSQQGASAQASSLYFGELPDDANTPNYIDLLTYLIKHWSESPKRIFHRTRKNESMEIAIGISAAHYFYQGDINHQQRQEEFATAQQANSKNTAAMPTQKPSRWVVLNLSAGGIALRKPPTIKEQLRVGSLLCMRDAVAKHWSVGVVRWAANNEEYQIDIGTQLISPTAKPIGIRKSPGDNFEKALILPGITVLKQVISIVAPGGYWSTAAQLEIEDAGIISRITLTKLIERTNSFEHFNFSYL